MLKDSYATEIIIFLSSQSRLDLDLASATEKLLDFLDLDSIIYFRRTRHTFNFFSLVNNVDF